MKGQLSISICNFLSPKQLHKKSRRYHSLWLCQWGMEELIINAARRLMTFVLSHQLFQLCTINVAEEIRSPNHSHRFGQPPSIFIWSVPPEVIPIGGYWANRVSSESHDESTQRGQRGQPEGSAKTSCLSKATSLAASPLCEWTTFSAENATLKRQKTADAVEAVIMLKLCDTTAYDVTWIGPTAKPS